MDLAGRSVAIVGLGQSGLSAARLCMSRGANVVGLDEAERHALAEEANELERRGMRIDSGPFALQSLMASDLVVVSPGVPERPAIREAQARGCDLVSEIELASRWLTAPMVLVGGTNGKSTVTAWSAAMLEAAGRRVFLGGNYGTPLCDAVGTDFDALVVEISSFQAERVPTLHARVHALLNISEDHLDRYADFQAYADAKGNPFVNMGRDDVAVIPAGDEACAAQARRGKARIVTFGVARADVALEGGAIVDHLHSSRYPTTPIRLRGQHNLVNALACVAVAGAMGVTGEPIERSLASFTGLAHRHVLVAEAGGVRFYDDSKATNVGAAVAALMGLEERHCVLIAGGRDKQGAYGPLVEALRARGRALVLMGEAADRIEQAASGMLQIERVTSMDEAVRVAYSLAKPGDAVLLSPACSSFDMFANYKERGDAFVRAVSAALSAALGGEP